MLDIDRPADEVVTDHCALRYLDRVLGVPVHSFSADGESQRLRVICFHQGFTPEVLKGTIASPKVRVAIALGAEKVLVDGHWLAFSNRRVVTVLEPDRRHHRSQAARSRKKRHKRFTQSPRRDRARFDPEEDRAV